MEPLFQFARIATLVCGLVFIAAAPARATDCGTQLTDNNQNDRFGLRQPATSQGRAIWFDDDNTVFVFDGAAVQPLQAADSNNAALGGITDSVFCLGSGSQPAQVLGAWRRGTDFAWIWPGIGHAPQLAQYTNPYNANDPMNPEGVAIADGCVFMLLQAASGGTLIKHVYRIDPASAAAELLTADFLNDVNNGGTGAFSTSLVSSGCKAAWAWCSAGQNGSCNADAVQLHYFDGAAVHVIDTDAEPLSFAAGRLIYSKGSGPGASLMLFDTTTPSPAPQELMTFSDDHQLIYAQTDGRHVAVLRGDANFAHRDIVLLGGFPLSDANHVPADQPTWRNVPIQLNRGQALWETQSGPVATFNGESFGDACSPGWLADGFVEMSRMSTATGPDTEIFLKQLSQPNDPAQPAAPWCAWANATANGEVTLGWETILGATGYHVSYAEQAGVTPTNYASLPGGAQVATNGPSAVISGLRGNRTYYFVVSTIDGSAEGPASRELSVTPCVDDQLDSDNDGTPDCQEEPDLPNTNPDTGGNPACGAGTCGVGAAPLLGWSLVSIGALRLRRRRNRVS